MNIEVIQNFNQKYYEEAYQEWLIYRSKSRKWQHKVGYLAFLIAVLICFFDRKLFPISGGLVVFGTLMIYDFYSSKRKWMKARLGSKINNQSAKIIFKTDSVSSFGPFTQVSGKWEYFREAIETKKGLILIPENGISIYLQKQSFENQSDIQLITKKIIEANLKDNVSD